MPRSLYFISVPGGDFSSIPVDVLEESLLEALRILLGNLFIKGGPPVDARGMGEQVPHRDLFLARALETRQVALHRSVQVEPLLVDQDHRRGGGGDHLGEARQVVDRVGRDRGRAGLVGLVAEGAAMEDLAVLADQHHPAREGLLCDVAVEQGVHLGEAGVVGRFLQLERPPRQRQAVAERVEPGRLTGSRPAVASSP